MTQNRIIRTNSFAYVSTLINQDFSTIYPVPLRGIMCSLNGELVLMNRENSSELRVKTIEEILNDGSELNLKQDYYITKVDEFSTNERALWVDVYANSHVICQMKANFQVLQGNLKYLKTAVLVYDKTLFDQKYKSPYIFNRRLPANKGKLSKIILKAYIIDEECTRPWSPPPF